MFCISHIYQYLSVYISFTLIEIAMHFHCFVYFNIRPGLHIVQIHCNYTEDHDGKTLVNDRAKQVHVRLFKLYNNSKLINDLYNNILMQ